MNATFDCCLFIVVLCIAAGRLTSPTSGSGSFNSPDGERYLKRRLQGPFVPLSAEDNAADDARKR